MHYVNPAPLKKDGFKTPEMKRLYTILLKFLKNPVSNFHDLGIEPDKESFNDSIPYETRLNEYRFWQKYPNCGYFFTGCHWYGTDQSEAALLLAFAAKYGDYDETVAGIPREDIKKMAIKVLRYACFTHDTGPEECVRVDGRNRLQAKTKWGGNFVPWPGPRSKFFQSSQVGSSIQLFGLAAWILWDDLDEETRQMSYNVVTDYAERWWNYEPRDGVYYNTQAEENGWTAMGTFTAAVIFPDDPRAANWREGALRWLLDSGMTPLDMVSSEKTEDGKALRERIDHITIHPDFTTENHSMVHPGYLGAPITFRERFMLYTLLAGADVLPGIFHNWQILYNNAFKIWSGADSGAIPIQSQDWWYYSVPLTTHVSARLLFHDPHAALLEQKAIDTFERSQASHINGTIYDDEPEKCIVSSDFQNLADMEVGAALAPVFAYLWHMCLGEGIAPVNDAQFEKEIDCVRNYPYGGSVVHRTAKAFSAFTYRNMGLAFVLPEDKLWTITTPPASTFGEMKFKGGCPENEGWSNQVQIRRMDDIRVYDDSDTYAASLTMDRGMGRVQQDVSFISLPDGSAVYFQKVKALQDCEIDEFTSGLVGVRNEHFKCMPEYAKGYHMLYVDNLAPEKMEGYIGGSDVLHDYKDASCVTIDDKISYLVRGSNGVRYREHHDYPKWKGIEDFLILNEHENLKLKAGETLPFFTLVFLPNMAHEAAKEIDKTFYVSCGGSADAAILGDKLVYSTTRNTKSILEAQFALSSKEVPLFAGEVSFRDGVYTWRMSGKARDCGYLNAAAKVCTDRNFDAIVMSNGMVLIRYAGEETYRIL